jgi:uncharacterized protein (DUF952 family)
LNDEFHQCEPKWTYSVNPEIVCKIARLDQWIAASKTGQYLGSNDDVRDGYIHLSAPAQLAGTLVKYFSGCDDLMLVAFAASDLGPKLRWERSRGGQLFPHLYAPLPTALALWQRPLTRDAGGIATIDEAWF